MVNEVLTKTTKDVECPDGWFDLSLDDLLDPSRETDVPTAGGVRRYVGLEHLDSGYPKINRFGNESEVRSAKACFRPGDLLYGKLRPYLDKVALAEWEGLCSTDILVLRAKTDRALAEYCVYLMHSKGVLDQAIKTTSGVNHPRTKWTALKEYRSFIPPKPEQVNIADVLSCLIKSIDLQKEIVEKTKKLKKSLMQKLFTEGLRGEELKETEIGPIPKSWAVASFAVSFDKAKVSRQNQINTSEIKIRGQFPVIDQGQSYIAGYSDETRRVFTPEKPVIVFGDHTRVFKCIDFPFIIGADGTKVFYAKEGDFEALFYYYTLAKIDLPSRGYNRHFKLLKEQKLAKPSLVEQREISDVLSDVDRKISVANVRLSLLKELFQSMLRSLMTGRIRVKDIEITDE